MVAWGLRIVTWALVLIPVRWAVRPPASLLAKRRHNFTQRTSAYLDLYFAEAFDHETRRRLCERPTPAVDPSHLYLQDAWRSSSLSAAYGLVCISAYGASLSLVFVPDLRWLHSAVRLMLYPALGAVAVVWVVQWRWFRRRLWRGLPPGQPLLPGQTYPPGAPG